MKIIFWLVMFCLLLSIGMYSVGLRLNQLAPPEKETPRNEIPKSPLTLRNFPPDLRKVLEDEYYEAFEEQRAYPKNPELTIKTEYYEVEGTTDQELFRNIFSESPISVKGEIFAGQAYWEVHWKFWWKETPADCTITSVKTFVDIQYLLPRRPHAYWGSHALEEQWQRYSTTLRHHEIGHAKFGIAAAKAIKQVLEDMPPMNSCLDLEQQANSIGYSILEDYSRRNQKYDVVTDHGRNQGVRWE